MTLAPCDVPGLPGKARCGTYEVWENREARSGRRIPLKVVVVPATGPDRASDPFTFFHGGPGAAATDVAPDLAHAYAKILERRDILLVDQRGTGGSHPLNCEIFQPPGGLQAALGAFFPLEAVRQCRATLEKDADLELYTTSIAMDDIDDVRAALGYDRLNILGGSYGTRAAQVYMRRHPEHVRTVILEGVVPMDDKLPLHIPPGAERALRGVLGECAQDAACHAAFPRLEEESRAVWATLARGPVTARVLNPNTGEPVDVSLSRDLGAEGVRYMLYSSSASGEVPAVLHQAFLGDYTAMAERAITGRVQIVASGSIGMYLSATCAEDVPWIDPKEAARLAAGTFIGDYRYVQQRAACGLWPRGNIPKGFLEPVDTPVPVLLLSGMWDPATPPSDAEKVARHLPKKLNVVVPHGAHGFDGLEGAECVTNLEIEFVGRGSLEGLSTACVDKIRRRPFRVEPLETKVVVLPEADLAKFLGSYVGEGEPAEAEIDRKAGKLRLQIAGQGDLLLSPTSATRFRVAGESSLLVVFDVADGAVRSATVLESGNPVLKLVPKPKTN
ncbi:MAG TPA: alpha/beta fold hydrolase [Thermoanaerobaculia bacterium]|nr:alpha/beta fold hydrolase [Thermoanaerobaculia bacterium]